MGAILPRAGRLRQAKAIGAWLKIKRTRTTTRTMMNPRPLPSASNPFLTPYPPVADKGEPTAAELFKKRILPIFDSPSPSSCVQCHLAGVGLKNYILPSHEKTFLSLRDQGLIDLDSPEKSKVLKLIQMTDPANKG